MIKRFFILLLAIVASVGMSWATTTDLASITDNYTAQDGEILTGTLGVNVKISIADGATVTLLNANINGDKTWTTGDYAGLTCLGDATITIVGTNSVCGFSVDNGYPGIYVPSGKTLIINGTGSLMAQSSAGYAAGIGAYNTHCGNIEIQSGKITAIAGGERAAGIGGAYNANCGNITISGGIVTAVGGDQGPGIGGGRRGGSTDAGHCGNILISGGVVSATSGEQAAAIGGGRGNNVNYKANCGTITITNTALKVYADQGGSSTNTIGAGKYGTCGTVTIGGNTGVINDDPYTYRTKEDGEIVVDYINAIGTVVYTQECKDKIDIARELYDALEDSQKTLVTNYQTLLDAEAAYAALIPQPGPAPTTWTSLQVGDVIKVGDQLSPSVEWESANDYGVIKPAWAPYTLLRANIAQEHEWDDPVVTEAEDGAYYVFKFTHPTSGTSYLLSNSAKSPLLAATATSDGLEVTNVGDDYGTPAFTFAVHDGGGSSAPSWVLAGDVWDEDTKTLTVNSNPGYEAYYQNTQIEHLIISDGVTTIGESAFDECTALLSVVIGNDVTNIEAYAFDECRAMTSLTIGNKVQTIGESAFGSCEELTSVTIPNSVTSIGESAFDTCDKISSLTIGNSVQSIGEDAFTNCSALTDVTIPASVENIGNWFFRNCANLTTITCEATTPPTLGNNAFFDCDKLAHIYVPAASVATYKAAANWSDSASIISAIPAEPIPCTAADLGKVLCTDGSIYATVSEATAASKTAVAMIAYVDTENGKALALALADESGTMEWETAKTTAAAHTPAVSGGTWTLASKDDWNNMITAAGSYTALRDGFSGVGGTNMQQDKYWSSTPENANAWCYYFNYGMWTDGYVDNPCRVRACLAFDIPAAPAYETVMNLIEAIGTVELTAECKAKIDAARAAYDALSTEDKALVTNYTTLTTAEAAFENVMNIWLSGDCDAILWKDTTLTVRKHAGEGNGAMADYNYMSRAPWYSAHWYDPQPSDIVIKSVTIEEGVTHLGDYAFAWMSEMKTATIPSSVTTIPEDAFYWSKAVDDIYLTVADTANLTWALPYSADNQFKPSKATRCHVPADLLNAYQEKFSTLNVTFVGDLDPATPLTPEEQQALDAVKGLINAIPSPVVYTPACKDAIDAARAAYDALTPDMLKQLVSNYATLTAAEATYANLKDVVEVEAKINNIPQPVTLKLATGDSIQAARAAYEALNAEQKLLVSNYDVLTDAEAELATLNPGGGAPAGALNGKFTINAGGDQIAFAKGNLQATTTDLGAHWTWGFAANQWNYLGIVVANNKIDGNGTVSENGTVDLFGWSTAATYYGINNSYKAVDYIGDFVDWGPNMGAGWRTLTKDEWNYLIENNTKGRATVNDKNGYIFLPNDWSGPAFTPDPDNFTTNVYSGDDWTAMENAGAVFLPSGPARNGKSALIANDAKYCSSTSLNNDTSYVFTIYYNQSQSACTGTNRAYGCMVRLVTEGGGATPLDSAQVVKDLIDAIPMPVTLEDACVNAVQAARDAYNALSDATKGALDKATVDKLNQAIADYTALIQAGADAVKAKIAAIPQPVTLKLATRDSINNARAAYDALTADQKALVTNYPVLTAAEEALAGLNPGGGMPAGALNGKFTINAGGDQIAFSKGNLQATTTDLGANWTWGFAANQWDFIGNAAANNAISGNGTVSANGTVDLFGWSTPTTYYGIHNSTNSDYYSSDFREWGENITGATWKTLSPSDWIYIISNRADAAQKHGQATVNGVNGYIFLPDEWELPSGLSFTAKPNNWTANVYDGDAWTAMENAGAVFLPKSPWRSGNTVNTITYGYYWSSDYNNYSNAMAYYFKEDLSITGTGTPRYAGICVRLVTADAGGATPLDSAQAVKDLIEAIPAEITTDDACVKAIEDARAAYDALAEATKGALDAATVNKLTDAEAAYAALIKAEADAVVAKINNIPMPVELKLATRDSIQNARAAYEALNAYQKPMVTNYSVLTAAEDSLAALNPGVPPATPLDSAQAVKDLIDAIPDSIVYPTSGPAIAAALVAYNQLSDAAKGALDTTDVQKMTDAATLYAALDAIAAIENIPDTITYDPLVKAAIETARDKYDALIDASKALVSEEVLHKLTNAEQAWAILAAKIEHNVTYIGKDAELEHETVALFKIPDPAPEFNGYEFVRWDVKAGDFLEQGLRIKAVYTPIITTNPVAYDSLMYNGTAQTLVSAGVAKEGHVEYRINDGEWSSELPKATFAAAYVVYYKLVREGHPDYIADSIVSIIAKAPVVYTAPTAVDSLVYNAANQTLIAAGTTADGTFEYSLNPTLLDSWKTELPKAMSAGMHNVYYRVQGDLNHLDSAAVDPIAVTIAKAELTAKADDKNVIYGDAVPAYTITYAGWQGEEGASVLKDSLIFACDYNDTTSVGTYPIIPSGVTADNYDITFVNGLLTVGKAESGCLAPVAFDTLVYNGINQTLIIAGQALGGEMQYSLDTTVADCWSTALPQAKDAATYNVYYRVKGDKNHNDHYYNLIAVTIAKAALTATAENKTVTYGDPAPTYTVAYTGWKGTDEASVLTGTIAYACTYAPLSNVGNYTITPSGVDAANYIVNFVNGTLTVVKAPVAYVAPVANELTYTAAPQTLITAGTTNDGQFVYRLGAQGEYDGILPQATHVGAYDVYYKVLGDINHLDSIIATPVAVNIDKAPLTATADNKTVIFGENIPAYTVTYAGWLGNDKDTVLTGAIAYACEYVKGSAVGEYVITPSGVDAADYDITFVNGTLTVNRKSATSDDITAKQADNETLVYDAAANKPTIQVKDTTKTLIEDTDYKLTFIGRGNTEYAESATAPAHVGDYTAVVAFIGNYKDTLTVDFVINKAPLTITADNKQVTFGEFAPEFTVSYEGWQGTDTATVLTGSQAYTCAYVRGNNVGEYTIIPSGVEAHDYAITFVNGTLTVNRKSAKSADIAAKQADNETLVYDADVNRPTIQVKDTTLVLTETQDYVLTFKGIAADQSTYAESETAPTHVGNYTAVVAFIGNYIDTLTVDFVINKAPLTITADNKVMIYGDPAPAFTVSYNGWQGNDSANVLLGTQAYDCIYAPGSPIGTYVITPKGVDAYDYAITFVDGTLTVNKAHVYVSGAEAQTAKFADGHAGAVVLNQGLLNGVKLQDAVGHVTTAAFSTADVAEHLTITLFYELTGDAALLNNYDLQPTSEVFTTEGVIIEPFIPDTTQTEEQKEEQTEVQEGIDVYAYGYCDGSGYSLKYHLNTGNPDQYKIDFADSRFTDVPWTDLDIAGKDGTIDIDIPVDMPTGDYSMTVYFRDSRFTWLESQALTVTFHVNLPETYVQPLFDNTIVLIDTCECFTDIQWYYREDSSQPWEPIPGATGHYYHADGKLTGEYFVQAKMNGVPTYTCGQDDMNTLYGGGQQAKVSAYPNPVLSTTTVTIENAANNEHQLRVVNLMGIEIFNTTFEGAETILDMSGYVTGNYMITVDGVAVKVMKK